MTDTQKPKLYVPRQGDGKCKIPKGSIILPGVFIKAAIEQTSNEGTTYLIPITAVERWVLLEKGDVFQSGDEVVYYDKLSGEWTTKPTRYIGETFTGRIGQGEVYRRRQLFPDIDALLRERDEAAVIPTGLSTACTVKERDELIKKIDYLQSQLESVTKERDHWKSRFEDLEKGLAEHHDELCNQRDALQAKLTAAEREVDKLCGIVIQHKQERSEQELKAVHAEARVKELDRTVSERESSYRVLMEKHETLRAEHEKAKVERDEFIDAHEKAINECMRLQHELDTLKSSLRWIPVSERMPTQEDARRIMDGLLRVEAFNSNNGMRGYVHLDTFLEEGCKWTHFRTPTAGPEPAKTEAQRIAEEITKDHGITMDTEDLRIIELTLEAMKK
jgi:hypothetical protein